MTKKVFAGAIPLIAVLAFVAPAQAVHSPAGVCARMESPDSSGDIGGSSNGGYSPPFSQAYFIAVSQGMGSGSPASNGFTSGTTYQLDGWGTNYSDCTEKFFYTDAFGVYRYIKIYSRTYSHWNGSDDIFDSWLFFGRDCYLRTNPANSWTAWNCA